VEVHRVFRRDQLHEHALLLLRSFCAVLCFARQLLPDSLQAQQVR
jgi:hypothetical protein